MADSSTPKKTGEVRCRWLSSSFSDLDDGPNCEPHSDGKSSSRRTFPILGPGAGGYLRAIVGIDDAGANRPEAHLRLRKPPPGRGRGAADGVMTSAASKRSISAKPARSRRK